MYSMRSDKNRGHFLSRLDNRAHGTLDYSLLRDNLSLRQRLALTAFSAFQEVVDFTSIFSPFDRENYEKASHASMINSHWIIIHSPTSSVMIIEWIIFFHLRNAQDCRHITGNLRQARFRNFRIFCTLRSGRHDQNRRELSFPGLIRSSRETMLSKQVIS